MNDITDTGQEAEEFDPLEDKELLVEIARALVDTPRNVWVEEKEVVREGMWVLYLHVATADRGKVIGRKGRTITAIRNLFSSIGAADGRKVLVKIAEDPTDRMERRPQTLGT